MELRNCIQCGKLFVYISKALCPDCLKKENEMFEKVRDYINQNPDSSLKKVSEKTGVDTKKILGFLKEGRLLLKKANANILNCEVCGEAILTGRYCEKCAKELKNKFNKAFIPTYSSNEEGLRGKLHLSKIKNRGK